MNNKVVQEQQEKLISILLSNPNIKTILDSNPIPDHPWYLAAGCIYQTVWNFLSEKEITQGINDYDLIYYDSANLDELSEENLQKNVADYFAKLNIKIDLVNEARVHIWFEEEYGQKIDQIKSCEEAISSWPTTATSIGVNKINNNYNIYAPFGLDDLFSMTLRPNKTTTTLRWVYEDKVKHWISKWPNLKVLVWDHP